jgi:hypothetical protein
MLGRFHRLINDLSLHDVHLHDRKFTWPNQQDQPTLVRLDRVLYSMDWDFPNHLLQSAAMNGFDHCPFLLSLNAIKPGKARSHFEAFWTRLQGFQETMDEGLLYPSLCAPLTL